MKIELSHLYASAILLRLILLAYGEWQDKNLNVKYTDVDYHVFTDASAYVLKGESPYLRPTYRYSPLLAWMLLPCHILHIMWGKILFIAADIATGILIQRIIQIQKCSATEVKFAVAIWMFNPLTMNISSRGNAESIMSLLVMATLYALCLKHTIVSSLLFSISVHLKIFPLIYALPIYLFLGSGYDRCRAEINIGQFFFDLSKFKITRLLKTVFSNERLKFFLTSLVFFLLISYVCYFLYGFDFLEHTYLYHVNRKDIRHNFSVYFYMLYTNSDWWLGLMCFLNQLIVLTFTSFCFYKDLPFCCFLLTFSFVTFNKVCTSQYFIWHLTLLPLLVRGLSKVSKQQISFIGSIWISAQSLWLASAYLLEFHAESVFLRVWTSSIVFFITNIAILMWFIRTYTCKPTFLDSGALNTFDKIKKS